MWLYESVFFAAFSSSGSSSKGRARKDEATNEQTHRSSTVHSTLAAERTFSPFQRTTFLAHVNLWNERERGRDCGRGGERRRREGGRKAGRESGSGVRRWRLAVLWRQTASREEGASSCRRLRPSVRPSVRPRPLLLSFVAA